MKENWERSKPFHLLSKQEIEGMLQSFLPNKRLASFELMGGGFSNSNYKMQVESIGKPLVLRITKQEVGKVEHALHSKLHKRLPVPEIYYSERHGDQSFAIMEWKEGVQLKEVMVGKDVDAIRQTAFSVGYWLSEIRKHRFEKSGFFNETLEVNDPLKIAPESFLSLMEQFLIDGQTGRWLGKELTSRVWDFAQRNNRVLENIDVEPALVHSDFNGLNILVDEKSEVAGIIDWEFAFAGPIYVDIGNLLRYRDFSCFNEFKRAFIEGLQSGGITLPNHWEKIAELVDLIALCSMLNNNFGGTNRINDITQLITQTLSRWND